MAELIRSPAFDRAVGSHPARVQPSCADREKLPAGWRSVAHNLSLIPWVPVQTPAFDGAADSHTTRKECGGLGWPCKAHNEPICYRKNAHLCDRAFCPLRLVHLTFWPSGDCRALEPDPRRTRNAALPGVVLYEGSSAGVIAGENGPQDFEEGLQGFQC